MTKYSKPQSPQGMFREITLNNQKLESKKFSKEQSFSDDSTQSFVFNEQIEQCVSSMLERMKEEIQREIREEYDRKFQDQESQIQKLKVQIQDLKSHLSQQKVEPSDDRLFKLIQEEQTSIEFMTLFKERQSEVYLGQSWKYWSCKYRNIEILNFLIDQRTELLESEQKVIDLNEVIREQDVTLVLLFLAQNEDNFVQKYFSKKKNFLKFKDQFFYPQSLEWIFRKFYQKRKNTLPQLMIY